MARTIWSVFRSVLLLLVAALPASDVLAQGRAVVRGERVRITTERSWIGVVERSTSDSISVSLDGAREPLTFALSSIDRLDVSAGRRSRSKGFLIGAGVGGAAGLLVGALAGSDACGVDPQNDILKFGGGVCDVAGDMLMVVLPVVGILVGGGTGALANGGERWETIRPPAELALVGSPGGRVGLALEVGTPF